MRAVIAGMGVVTPVGLSPEELQEALLSSRMAYWKLEGPKWAELARFRTSAGGVVEGDIEQKLLQDLAGWGFKTSPDERCESFALHACRQAMEQAAPALPVNPRIAFIMGTNFGNAGAFNSVVEKFSAGEDYSAQFDATAYGLIARRIASQLGLNGPVYSISLSCASGVAVIAQATRLLAAGGLDAAVVCGVDEMNIYIYSGLNSLRAMSPENVVRPWDVNRKGTIFGEGAAAMVLLPPERAQQSPVQIAIRAAWQNNDGFHLSAPDTTAGGIRKLIETTLQLAEVAPEDIGFVNAHGTGTPYNDKIETAALRAVMGSHAETVPVTANKGALSHLMGAAGLAETVSAAISLQTGIIPPTSNLTDRDPEIAITVPTQPLQHRARFALKNSFGFGGANACVVLENLKW